MPAPRWFQNKYSRDVAKVYLAFHDDGTFEWLTRLDATIRIYGPCDELLQRFKKKEEKLEAVKQYFGWIHKVKLHQRSIEETVDKVR